LILERPADRQKVVVFTESLKTQDYLRDLLLQNLPITIEDITIFRGVNESAVAASALARWKREVEPEIPTRLRPTQDIAMRLALVHEFRTLSKIFISSEAGAKGLNLQFCDTLVNYDLPWNPQRIEQRIGRCHRYGQKRDVTVINFIAKDNEAQRLTFEILSTKLDLFGKVLDSSDVVLQTPRSDSSEALASSLGPEFEAEIRQIWDRARSSPKSKTNFVVSGILWKLGELSWSGCAREPSGWSKPTWTPPSGMCFVRSNRNCRLRSRSWIANSNVC
jgi:hypothetical protein